MRGLRAADRAARSRCSRCTASSPRSRGPSRRRVPGSRLGYVQTEGGALAGGHSRTVRALRERGLLAGHLTAGAAFGGEGEAITTAGALHHGLRTLGWDAAVCGPGPGIVGSGSPLGHGGMSALDSAHVALALGCSDAARGAHVLGRSARAPSRHLPPHADRARPAARAGDRRAARRACARPWAPSSARWPGRGASAARCRAVRRWGSTSSARRGSPATTGAARSSTCPPTPPPACRRETMGRGLTEDPLFFGAALAGGARAGRARRADAARPRTRRRSARTEEPSPGRSLTE